MHCNGRKKNIGNEDGDVIYMYLFILLPYVKIVKATPSISNYGSVRVPLNLAWSAYFFIQNSVFLSQIPPNNSDSSKIQTSEQAL